MEKEENAGNQHFLLLLQYFVPYQRGITILAALNLLFANAFNLVKEEFLLYGKELNSLKP